MILYKKSGEFLGIGKEELSFLGYEDLEEFKSTYDDVADLFVNRPGYIFKFKNFSWIDYALHSGAPKKSVILKLKTGNEVETAIKIKELFLNNPKEDEDIYYCVEFSNSMLQSNSMQTESFVQSNSTSSFTSYENEENSIQKIEHPKIKMSSLEEDFEAKIENQDTFELKTDTPIIKETEIVTNIDIKDDFTQDYVAEEPNYEEDFLDEKLPIKLKIESLPVDEEFNLKENNEESISIDEEPKIKIAENDKEDFPSKETPVIKPKIESLPVDDESTNIDKEEIEEFDLLNCVEEVGLDIALVSEIITDYIKKLDKRIPKIRTAILEENKEQLEEHIYNLKGISDNLHIHHLSNKLVEILNSQSKAAQTEKVEEFEKIVTIFKGEFIWNP